jgi:hypothetical protein
MTSTFSREEIADYGKTPAEAQADNEAELDAADEDAESDKAADGADRAEPAAARTSRWAEEDDLGDLPSARSNEPMPDMADDDVQFDSDKYRAKMQKWVQRSVESGVETALSKSKTHQSLESKIQRFAKDHPDFEQVVNKNPVLAANQLGPDAAVTVARSPYAAHLLYRFGKDPGLAVRVAKMSPGKQVMAVVNMIRDIQSERASATARTESAQRQASAGKGTSPTREQQLSSKTSMDAFAQASRSRRHSGRYYK